MITRRKVLAGSLVVPALAVPPLSAAPRGAAHRSACDAAQGGAGRSLPVGHFILDPRFAVATRIAGYAAAAGLATLELPRDAVELWQGKLGPSANDRPSAFAGVTTEQAFFVLRTLAADHRLRVVFQARHAPPQDGQVRHTVEAPAANLLGSLQALRAGDWQAGLAASLGQYASGKMMRARQVTPAGQDTRRSETLVSWVIAPAAVGV